MTCSKRENENRKVETSYTSYSGTTAATTAQVYSAKMSASTYDDITRVARAKNDQEIYHCSSAHYSELLQRYAESDAAASLVAREKQIRLGHVQGRLTRICVRAG
jgi:hypothetical protein